LSVNDSVTFYDKTVKHEVENCMSVAWRSDERFTMPGDSGSVYYAVRGCFRYPIAVHRAGVVVDKDDFKEKEGGKFEKVKIPARISIGTPLLRCLDEYAEKFNERKSSLDINDEDSVALPEWIDFLEPSSKKVCFDDLPPLEEVSSKW